MDESKIRLNSILDEIPSNPPIPVQVISTDDDADITEIQEELGLEALKNEGKIKSYEICIMSADIFHVENMGKIILR